jgi:hypothetical protein
MVIIIPEPEEAFCEKSHRWTVKYSPIETPIQADYDPQSPILAAGASPLQPGLRSSGGLGAVL